MTHDLPPLPEILGDGFTRKWIEDRMQAYALAAIAPYKAEIERLKLECANTELDSGEYKLRAEKAEAEVARLKAGGCARDQRLTQYCAEAARLAEENAKLRTTLEIVLHAFEEIHHASTRPDWFTRGQEGATQHRLNWERRCIATIKTALGEKKNG
jgi:hypothetical protein